MEATIAQPSDATVASISYAWTLASARTFSACLANRFAAFRLFRETCTGWSSLSSLSLSPGRRFKPIPSQTRNSCSASPRTRLLFASAASKRKSQSACHAICPGTTYSAPVGAATPEEVASGAGGGGNLLHFAHHELHLVLNNLVVQQIYEVVHKAASAWRVRVEVNQVMLLPLESAPWTAQRLRTNYLPGRGESFVWFRVCLSLPR